MQVEVVTGSITEIVCDTLIVSIFEGVSLPGGAAGAVDTALNGQIASLIRGKQGAGKYGSSAVLHICSGIGAKQVVLLGLGKQEEFTLDRLRGVAGTAIRAAQKLEARTVATVIHGAGFDPQAAVQALVEGTLLGNYRFRRYKTEKDDVIVPEKLYIIAGDADKVPPITVGARRGQTIAAAVSLCRDLVNHPANYMTPARMAEQAAEIAGNRGLELEVLDEAKIAALGMKAFMAVAQGSHEPPRLIVMKYAGNPGSKNLLALVGKGVTFDSGGISLKPSEGMHEMKDDMAGAAAVLGAMQAIAELGPPVNILAVVPCTENLPSGYAFRPGDVIESLGGKTIEIISTDAEGRLILADAIAYALRLGATHIVDLATLTGACVVALGNVTSGVMATDRDLCRRVMEASEGVGEKMWELPLFEEYKEQIKSDIADLKNSGGRPAGAITAGLFIASFTGGKPWVHIDIAGTVASDKENGCNVKGATGVGVRTLVNLAESLGSW
ncbi:leucyl aminopeptidase [Anaeroselena agilis]|uniref:Probable cytosol aminopeptidase n=1 Tax=Anaeroselena agilis TaxID=3063788 RepID=A0ABU3NX42_9FIRM|nr:leucyl aminopeptidase [Selenomonadales bacterium 4137-cl]